jgi:hypothetical protein
VDSARELAELIADQLVARQVLSKSAGGSSAAAELRREYVTRLRPVCAPVADLFAEVRRGIAELQAGLAENERRLDEIAHGTYTPDGAVTGRMYRGPLSALRPRRIRRRADQEGR